MNDLISKLILPSFLRWVAYNCNVYSSDLQYEGKSYYLDDDNDVQELINIYKESL